MDPRALPEKLMEAGKEYEAELCKLGFRAHGVFWVYDEELKEFFLMIVSDLVDIVGPLRLMSVLFAAYNAALLPKEIDPFLVRLHSINQPFVQQLTNAGFIKYIERLPKDGRPAQRVSAAANGVGGFLTHRKWVVNLRNIKRERFSAKRQFESFEKKVGKLAA